MILVRFYRVKDGKVDRLRSWLREVQQRTDELVEGFKQETARHEVAYLIDGVDGPVLVYAMEAEDHARGDKAYEDSTIPLDVEHKKVMAEVLGDPTAVEKVFEFAIPPGEVVEDLLGRKDSNLD